MLAFSPNGGLALVAGQYVTVWDVATGSLINQFDTHVDDFGNPLNGVFAPDGTYVVVGGHSEAAQEPELTLWDVKTGMELTPLNRTRDGLGKDVLPR